MENNRDLSHIKYLKKLVELLNIAKDNMDIPMVTGLISHHLDGWFNFKPGLSNWTEIVIEYLQGEYPSDPAKHIQGKYSFTESEAEKVYDELQRFHTFKY